MGPEEQREELAHLKRVSRVKHIILEKYLPAWETILGSKHAELFYVDCYAGPGRYEFQGGTADGSPIIALRTAREYSRRHAHTELYLIFVEKSDSARRQLESILASETKGIPSSIRLSVLAEDSKDFVPSLRARIPRGVPAFFLVDPHGHPLTIPILNDILSEPRTEAFITFMYYRINMDAANPRGKPRVDEMFGDQNWRLQPFIGKSGKQREEGFLTYFKDQITAKYKLHFKIRYDPEDRLPGTRTKYYLIHASNHPRAALLMKEVMWPLGDEGGLFDYSGRLQGYLFSNSPTEESLRELLLERYSGKEVAFDDLRVETLQLPFVEKHYRSVIRQLRDTGLAEVTPVSSKKTGIKERDIVRFLGRPSKELHGGTKNGG